MKIFSVLCNIEITIENHLSILLSSFSSIPVRFVLREITPPPPIHPSPYLFFSPPPSTIHKQSLLCFLLFLHPPPPPVFPSHNSPIALLLIPSPLSAKIEFQNGADLPLADSGGVLSSDSGNNSFLSLLIASCELGGARSCRSSRMLMGSELSDFEFAPKWLHCSSSGLRLMSIGMSAHLLEYLAKYLTITVKVDSTWCDGWRMIRDDQIEQSTKKWLAEKFGNPHKCFFILVKLTYFMYTWNNLYTCIHKKIYR